MQAAAFHALARFGLGRRPAEPVPLDAAAWARAQITQPDPALALPVPSAADGLLAIRQDREAGPQPGESKARAIYRASAQTLLDHAVSTVAPFRERLVWFWTNHFTVSLRRGQVAGLAGAFVQEAIRPHVTGRFADMVLAVMRHPAMLLYLDNAASVGPDSPAADRGARGLNENLARECLELHTVTPASQYTQTDVTSFARVLTGWSIDMNAASPGFRYRPRAHQPGEHIVMGQRLAADEAGGVQALRFLADHPATHRALATKLARHFIADDPPAETVRRIEAVLRDTGGDLGAASLELIGLDAAWQSHGKLRTPLDYVVACVRLLAPLGDPPPNLTAILAGLGQPLWTAPAPNGWPDRADDWAGPEAMMRRIDWAHAFAARIGTRDPAELAEAALGPLLRDETLMAVKRAGSRRDGLTLLLTSPEFQRR